jgi:hypothetical protein
MTFLDVNRNGGPTAPTVAKAEAGDLDDPRPSTLSKFDAGLRWMPGSAAGTYWDGDEPEPAEGKRRQSAVLEPAAASVALPLDRVLALMTTQSKLNDLIDGSAESVARDLIRPIADELNGHLSAIVGVFATDLLERNRSQDSATIQPLLEYTFAELLANPVPDDDLDREEKLYRRWLLGNAEGIGPDLDLSFARRLRQRRAIREGTE